MIAGSVQTPVYGQQITRCGLIADIARTITARTPGDVRYIQYNTYYIEYNFLIWQIHPRRLDMASNQQRQPWERARNVAGPLIEWIKNAPF